METIHSVTHIQRRAREEAARHTDINDACPYPWGTAAAEVFKKEFHAERKRTTEARRLASIKEGKSWIVYGPMGCGKTRNAARLQAALGLEHLSDDGEITRKSFQPMNTLHLCVERPAHVDPSDRRVMGYFAAMELVTAYEATQASTTTTKEVAPCQ